MQKVCAVFYLMNLMYSFLFLTDPAHFFYKFDSLSRTPSLFYCPSTLDKHKYTTCKLNLLFQLLLSRIKSKECFFLKHV